MTTTLTIRDETTSGEMTNELTLDVLTEHITVRELIRSRVFQEVKDHNARKSGAFRGLVQPGGKSGGMIDWQKQFDVAIDAFERNRILVLVNDQQADDLEQEIEVATDTAITFLRLTPLVGG